MKDKLKQRSQRLLLPFSAFLSLAYAGYFVVGLHASSADTHPAVVAGQAVSRRVFAAADVAPRATVADIVTKALAFKATLNATQVAALEQTYTASLARKWSNLPCANTCRNGVGFGTLSADQLAAAIDLIRTVESSVANEGADEFLQIRMADDVLAAMQGTGGGGPGGLSYSSGNYYLAFLNTPTNSGAWMMQFGGHHYAANISFNGGHVVSTTPHFYGVEPTTFAVNGVSYSPVTQERDGLANMLAALTTDQLTASKLSQTFSDVSLIPGETQGGSGTFPTTRVGISVSGLSAAQKQLVLEAMKPWVLDMEASVAANLMSIYQNELDGTYIAWTGSGTSGNASSFLNANTNYARIDGPSVWIEFACQNGAVIRTQIHYHTVWRDRQRDYGKDLSLTTALESTTSSGGGASLTPVSAASYAAGSLAPESISTVFGTSLAGQTVSATTTPLPTTLGGVQVQVRDSTGATRNAPLFYVSPTQISYQIPTGTAGGTATVTVLSNGATTGSGTVPIEAVTPALFAANANGQGVAAAIAVRYKADGTQTVEPVLQLNSTTNQYEAVPLSTGDATDQLYLLLFGTGFRNRSGAVSATIGGTAADVQYAGSQGTFVGLDQANVRIPASLAGRGSVNVVMNVEGKSTNTVTISVR